jgi:hypothetical protein
MKKAGILNTRFCIILLGLFAFSLIGWAEWIEPVMMNELNDYVNMKTASQPTFLPDLSEMYFVRDYELFQAKINSSSGLYTNQRSVTELNRNQGIRSCWLSSDGLRLYYTERINDATRHVVQMASRPSLAGTWRLVRTLNEIHINIFDYSATLSEDELTILWVTAANPGAPITTRKAYMATRTSKTGQFGNIRELTELSSFAFGDVSLSKDGLILYFANADVNTFRGKLWKGTRQTINDLFGNFESLDDINKWGIHTYSPYPSVDQKTLWFTQYQQVEEVTYSGIFFSRWIETPYEKAVRCLTEARDIKIDILGKMDAADQKERDALVALSEMMKTGLPEGLTRRDINKVRLNVLYALCKQFIAEFEIKKSVKELENSITILDPNALDSE